MGKTIDLTGQKFGNLLVLSRCGSYKTKNGTIAAWLCKCECGEEIQALSSRLRDGTTKNCNKNSCKKPHHQTHGMSFSAEYRCYRAMRNRCFLPSVKQFPNYGGRGIVVCNRWLEERGFENFLADMGRKPSSDYSLDRINPEGNYEPSNCRWATQSEQSKNRRKFVAINNISTEDLISELKRRGMFINQKGFSNES